MKIAKTFHIKIISLIITAVFLCNTLLYPCNESKNRNSLRPPIGEYARIVDASIEDATQEKLNHVEASLSKILKDRKQSLSDRARDAVIRISMLPRIGGITGRFLRKLGDDSSLRRRLFFAMPFVKWLCKRFLLTVDMENASKFEQEIGKVVNFIIEKKEKGISVSLDNVGDAALSSTSAEEYRNFYINLINYLGTREEVVEINLSLKFSALCYGFDEVTEVSQKSKKVNETKQALVEILKAASLIKGKKVFIRIDMEEYAYRDITIGVFKEVIEENPALALDENGDLRLGIVIQAYLRDSNKTLDELLVWAEEKGYRVPVRLVKGAYDTSEKEKAKLGGYLSPVFDNKVSTDANYELLSEFLIIHREHFKPVFATHNIRSMAKVMALAEYYGLNKSDIEFQMLLGMGDEIKQVIVGLGYKMREYVPTGVLARGLKYSGRRFNELCNNDNALTRTLKGDYSHLKDKPEFKGEADFESYFVLRRETAAAL